MEAIGPGRDDATGAEQQDVGETFGYLLDMVSDHARSGVLAASCARGPRRASSRSRPPMSRPAHGSSSSKSSRFAHKGASQQDLLTFALGKHAKGPVARCGRTRLMPTDRVGPSHSALL